MPTRKEASPTLKLGGLGYCLDTVVSASMGPEPPHPSQALCGPNLALVHAKVVGDFMPERLLYQTLQILAVAS